MSASFLDNELLLQKMTKQLKCLPSDSLPDKEARVKRYSYVVNELRNGHRDAKLAERLLTLDAEAYRIELARRKAYDNTMAAIVGTFMFCSLFYATGISTLI